MICLPLSSILLCKLTVATRERARASFGAAAHAYHAVFRPKRGATWCFDPGSSVLTARTPRAHDLLLETEAGCGQSYLQIAWTLFVQLDTPLTRTMEE